MNNIEDAINYLYENKSASYEYKGMTISLDDNYKLIYTYNGKRIYPIYWYGYFPSFSYYGDIGVSAWYETNTYTTFAANSDNLNVTRTVSNTSRQCVGGFTTSLQVNLGSNLANESGYLTTIPAGVSKPIQYTSDITSLSGNYYLGVESFCVAGTLNVAAMWLE